MLAAWRLPGARFVTVEAQEESLRLARKSVRYNGLEDRFTLLRSDLRDESILAGESPFELVFGSPPYYPPGTATPAESPQAVPARIEVRGDVADYARAAARALAASGLAVLRTRDVVFKEGEPPRVRLWAAVRRADVPEGFESFLEPPLVTRRGDGSRSAEYAAMRVTMGFPPG